MPYSSKTRPYNGRGDRKNARPFRHKQRKPKHQGAFIHPSRFINRAVSSCVEIPYEAKHKFADFPFCGKLCTNIECRDYKIPSAIQDQAIPHIMAGRDIIGLANTGTGKTAAFLLPIISKISKEKKPFSTVILAPTRELAQQIESQFKIFSDKMGLQSVLLVGGSNIDRQMTYLKRKPQLVIATPGRIMDLVNRKKIPLKDVEIFVLDEADRMLDMGFIGDIRKIAEQIPESRQTLFFSATMTPKVKQLTEEFLRSPETISVRTADTSERVDQDIVEFESKEDKMEKLLNLLKDKELDKVLIFGRTKYGVQRLSGQLSKKDVSSVAIHGNKTLSQRRSALRSFTEGKARVMVATDVAARGLDIPSVSHVINFDQPATYEDYVHRIGRTGRGSATGVALTFVDKR